MIDYHCSNALLADHDKLNYEYKSVRQKWKTNYLITASEVSVWDFHITTERSRLLSCLLYGIHQKSKRAKASVAEVITLHPIVRVIATWALRESNALQLSDN